MNLSDSPGRPACPSRASGWSSLTTPWGLPCCVRFPCVHAVATTPAQRLGVLLRSFTQPYQPSPKGSSGRPAHRPFRGLLGVHSRYGLHTRAVTVYRDTLTRGFSHFVTSMTAPVASGWSGCRVGLTPTGKRRLSTAHTHTGRRRSNFFALRDCYSITSSARPSTKSGNVMPSAFAVLRLMRRSILKSGLRRGILPFHFEPTLKCLWYSGDVIRFAAPFGYRGILFAGYLVWKMRRTLSLIFRRSAALLSVGWLVYDEFTRLARRSRRRPRTLMIIELAARYHLPAIYSIRPYAEDRGLLSYGANIAEPARPSSLTLGDSVTKSTRAKYSVHTAA